MPAKDSTQKGQMKNYKKMKNEIAGNKEEVAEPEEHMTEEVGETEGNVKNEREPKDSSLSHDVWRRPSHN